MGSVLSRGRRAFLRRSLRRIAGAGLLCSPWAAFMRTGSVAGAYADELLSIEEHTRGRLKAGDVIDRDNVSLVKDLLDPVRYRQISEMGRRLTLAPTTTDLTRLSPPEYIEATLRHRGVATFDAKGNVVTRDGKPWPGGNPFPEPHSAIEVFAAHTLSWGRHDLSLYAAREYELDSAGNVQYQYASCWAEMAAVGRTVVDPKPYWTVDGQADTEHLRYQSVLFVAPSDARGTGYLSVWPYDQNQFPQLYGYLPAFKRVRRRTDRARSRA